MGAEFLDGELTAWREARQPRIVPPLKEPPFLRIWILMIRTHSPNSTHLEGSYQAVVLALGSVYADSFVLPWLVIRRARFEVPTVVSK